MFADAWNAFALHALLFSVTTAVHAQPTAPPRDIDVLHYVADVHPDIEAKTLTGKVIIRFVSRTNELQTIELDNDGLTVDTVRNPEPSCLSSNTTSDSRSGYRALPKQASDVTSKFSTTARHVSACSFIPSVPRPTRSSQPVNG